MLLIYAQHPFGIYAPRMKATQSSSSSSSRSGGGRSSDIFEQGCEFGHEMDQDDLEHAVAELRHVSGRLQYAIDVLHGVGVAGPSHNPQQGWVCLAEENVLRESPTQHTNNFRTIYKYVDRPPLRILMRRRILKWSCLGEWTTEAWSEVFLSFAEKRAQSST